jgi:hypothetical protein
MDLLLDDAIKRGSWKCLGTDNVTSYDGTATLMFPNVPLTAVAAIITVRGSSLDYSIDLPGWGADEYGVIGVGETRLIEGSYEYLTSLFSAGEAGLTTSHATYFGAK